jgi:glycosyltransferase involved in cell wall biosynthesis
LKILQLGKFYPPSTGGIETVMYDITEVLNNSDDIICDVLCSNKDFTYKENFINNYKVMRTKTLGVYFSTSITFQIIFKLKKIITQYDIIHIHLPDPMANLALLCVNTDKQKIILHWHSDIIKQKYLLKLYEPLQNWMMKKADKIIATTPKYIEESKYLQKYKEKCVSIPIGIDENKLISNSSKVKELKEIYKNKKIIFSLGRLVYYKGFEYLIKSSEYLDDNYIILIGGSGHLKEQLKNIINYNQLQGKVKLLGRVEDDELGSYYDACDIFCLPSIIKTEAFGIVQIEAMSFTKPIVTTKIDGSGVDWVNEHKVSGINVDIKNPEALAKAFRAVLGDENKYNKYCQNARTRFENLFLRKKMVNSIIDLYKEVLK